VKYVREARKAYDEFFVFFVFLVQDKIGRSKDTNHEALSICNLVRPVSQHHTYIFGLILGVFSLLYFRNGFSRLVSQFCGQEIFNFNLSNPPFARFHTDSF
jgi:hypothetical protein